MGKTIKRNINIYRYRFIDDELYKEEFQCQLEGLTGVLQYAIENPNPYYKVLNASSYSVFYIDKINKLSVPSCFFDYENDEDVAKFFTEHENNRILKAEKEIEKARARINSIEKLREEKEK